MAYSEEKNDSVSDRMEYFQDPIERGLGINDYQLSFSIPMVSQNIKSVDSNSVIKGVVSQTVLEMNEKYSHALEIIQIQADKIKHLSKIQMDENLSEIITKNLVLERNLTELQEIVFCQNKLLEKHENLLLELAKESRMLNQTLQELEDQKTQFPKAL